MNLQKLYTVVAFCLVGLWGCSSPKSSNNDEQNNSINKFKFTDESEHNLDDNVIGTWLNTNNKDTVFFKWAKGLNISNKKGVFIYRITLSNPEKEKILRINKMKCDTFKKQDGFDSISCKPIDNNEFLIKYISTDTIKLVSFIDCPNEVLLKRINHYCEECPKTIK